MKTFDLLIKGGTIVTAEESYVADIGVSKGKIAMIGLDLGDQASEVVYAEGKYVLPGAIDVHTHLEMPFGGTVSADDFYTGTVAAACGGTTSIIDFAVQGQGATLMDTIDTWKKKAEDKAVIDYGFHIAITDMNDDVVNEMETAVNEGFTSFKLFMTYDGMRVDDQVMLQALTKAKEIGALIQVHAENYYMIKMLTEEFIAQGKTDPVYHAYSRPPFSEAEAVSRAVYLAMQAEAPLYIVHLSSAAGLEPIKKARELGYPVMAETCPQYLVLDEEYYLEKDFGGSKYVMSPPLRHKENQKPLWKGLYDGNIQVVATDHCPFNFKGQKELGRGDFTKIPNGAPGVEARMMVLQGQGVEADKISLQKMVEVTSTNPAKIFGMYPKKGTIVAGSDADLVIWDPESSGVLSKEMLHENVDYTPFEGFTYTAKPVMTFSNGKIIVKNSEFIGEKGSGTMLKRKPITVL